MLFTSDYGYTGSATEDREPLIATIFTERCEQGYKVTVEPCNGNPAYVSIHPTLEAAQKYVESEIKNFQKNA